MACILKTNTNLKADRSVEIACTCRQIIGLPTSSCWLVFPKDFAASSSSVSSSCEASRLMTAHREKKFLEGKSRKYTQDLFFFVAVAGIEPPWFLISSKSLVHKKFGFMFLHNLSDNSIVGSKNDYIWNIPKDRKKCIIDCQ